MTEPVGYLQNIVDILSIFELIIVMNTLYEKRKVSGFTEERLISVL